MVPLWFSCERICSPISMERVQNACWFWSPMENSPWSVSRMPAGCGLLWKIFLIVPAGWISSSLSHGVVFQWGPSRQLTESLVSFRCVVMYHSFHVRAWGSLPSHSMWYPLCALKVSGWQRIFLSQEIPHALSPDLCKK